MMYFQLFQVVQHYGIQLPDENISINSDTNKRYKGKKAVVQKKKEKKEMNASKNEKLADR